jgi:predicted type IV restriction endonuclease
MTTPDALNSLAACLFKVRTRILSYRDRRVRLTESDTIRVLLLPILEALGWDLQGVEEVRSECRYGVTGNHVEYALFLRSTSSLFVGSKPLLQTLNRAYAAGMDWCALTSGPAWQFYKIHGLSDLKVSFS